MLSTAGPAPAWGTGNAPLHPEPHISPHWVWDEPGGLPGQGWRGLEGASRVGKSTVPQGCGLSGCWGPFSICGRSVRQVSLGPFFKHNSQLCVPKPPVCGCGHCREQGCLEEGTDWSGFSGLSWCRHPARYPGTVMRACLPPATQPPALGEEVPVHRSFSPSMSISFQSPAPCSPRPGS